MAHLFATAGSKLYIGAAKAYGGTDFIETDFTSGSPTWTEIGGITNLGGAGDSSPVINSTTLADSRVRKLKGSRNAGTMTVIANADYADAGQLAAIAAEKTPNSYAFKVQFNDAPAGGTPSLRYFVALVMSATETWDQADNVMTITFTLEIDSNIVRVDAAAA